MTGDTTPTIVAAANLSPVSPRPLHNTYALPQALPGLQSRAEDPDVVPLELDAFRTAEAAMAEPVPSQAVEEPTVESLADQTQDASISDDDDESFQYDDGENDNGGSQSAVQEQDGEQEVDDYARTFDSPAEKEQLAEDADADTGEKDQQPLQQQELVSNAAESMNISTEQPDQPDAVPAQTQSVSDSSILPSLADKGSPSIQPAQSSTATSSSVQKVEAPDPADNAQESTANFQEALPETVIASASPIEQSASAALQEGIENTGQPAQPAAALEDASVQSETKDVDMALDSAPDATALDIQKLVDEITAKADTPVAVPPTTASAATNPSPLSIPTASSMDVDMSSLPPKPALTQEQSKQTYSQAAYHHASLPTTPAFTTTSGPPPQPPYANNGAPGVSQPHNHKPSFSSYPNAYPPGTTPQLPTPVYIGQGVPQTYDEFLTEERKNMADAKWERFPDGSRIFIGNLSQERVSKRDVFDLFHRYGRLAQISLKSAYGFVQYHTVAEAQAAITNLQGIEVKGRNINLEISKTQKTKKDRDHSPERRNRGERGGRNGDRYDGRDGGRDGRRREDYRQPRSPSPRRDSHRGRQDSYGRDRGPQPHGRKRSRSPEPYRRQDDYRRRSPSPYGRSRQDADQLDIPRRYGNDVPDVQILLMQDVHKDFVDWVQRALYDRGLKTNAMFFNPRFPRDALIQRQVLEGVHGVVELDMRAQTTAKIPLQVFDRSAGNNNVRFDQYQDLDPPVAAELVLRARSSVALQRSYPPQQNYAPQQQYSGSMAYGGYQPPSQQPPASAPSDLASLVSQLSQMPNVDAASVQNILASLQNQQAPAPSHTPTHYPPQQPGGIDVNAFLSNLSSVSANPGHSHLQPAAAHQNGGRGGVPQPGAAGSSDSAREVENIMASLARYR